MPHDTSSLPESLNLPESSNISTLALDWDGVISHFPQEFALLAAKFDRIVIITLNRLITREQAQHVLAKAEIDLEICPDERRDDHYVWKAEIAKRYNACLFFDDDGYVVVECRSRGIPAIAINAAFFHTMLYDTGSWR